MPLPSNGTEWPPQRLSGIRAKIAEWDAWWVGDTTGLERAYGSTNAATRVRPSQMSGGVVGAVARFFWGRPQFDGSSNRTRLHIPVATDLCQASADLLWSEAPTVKVDDAVTQERLDTLIDDQALLTFAEGAEAGAAHGGHFLRVTWDDKVQPDGPFLTVVHADGASPEFRWGRLVAVTFWHTLAGDDTSKVIRHLERHELDASGVGVVLHGLYVGTGDNLGQAVPLTEHAATAGLADVVDDQSAVSTESPGLAVVYVPNQRPQRRWRTDPVGKDLGRSDLDGVEGPMDALDEVWSSWMRDIRLGKARLLASQSMLEQSGPGEGATFDLDREVFVPLNTPPSSLTNASGAQLAQAEQFAIRVEEHRQTANELIDVVLRTAGYSPATFGRGSEGGVVTATEVAARQQRSLLTRDRKLRAARPAVAAILEKLLHVDAAIFRTAGVKPERPSVEFPDGVQETLLELAQTAQALRGAEAASTMLLVQMLHPEWDDEQVGEEVARIAAERAGEVLPDPTDPALVDGAAPRPGMTPDELAYMIQKIYLGVGTVISAEEARDILNRGGAGLDGPAPQPGDAGGPQS